MCISTDVTVIPSSMGESHHVESTGTPGGFRDVQITLSINGGEYSVQSNKLSMTSKDARLLTELLEELFRGRG